MGRMGSPSAPTGPVVLLCSRARAFINGADLVVEGKCCPICFGVERD